MSGSRQRHLHCAGGGRGRGPALVASAVTSVVCLGHVPIVDHHPDRGANRGHHGKTRADSHAIADHHSHHAGASASYICPTRDDGSSTEITRVEHASGEQVHKVRTQEHARGLPGEGMLVKETTAFSNDILFWGRVQKFNRSTAGHRDMHVCIDLHHRMIHPWHLLKDVHHSRVRACPRLCDCLDRVPAWMCDCLWTCDCLGA